MTLQTTTKQPPITSGFLSISQIIGDDTHQPIIPISRTAFYDLIKRGAIPKPTKILSRNYYHIDTVNNIVSNLSNGAGALV
jgi:hypothetical protein